MRRKLILILTFPLTLLAVGILFNAMVFLSHDEPDPFIFVHEPDPVFSLMHMFVSGVMIFAVVGAGSFVSHVPVALALNKRLPADRLWLMILLSLAATVAGLWLSGLAFAALEEVLYPTQDSGFYSLLLLLILLLPGMVMSLIHVLVAFAPSCFLNRSNAPKTT